MGIYINRGNGGFRNVLNSGFVDKSGLIAVINKTLFTQSQFTCVTRGRRFGKSIAAEMLYAYYDKSCDSRSLFEGLEISKPDRVVDGVKEDKQFEKHLNKYPVIYLDITYFTAKHVEGSIVSYMQSKIIKELITVYEIDDLESDDDLMDVLCKIVEKTGERFIMIIDEWDAICREYRSGSSEMDDYVNLLRRMFKSVASVTVFAGVYMTGILPIKKYNTQSALNNFEEYSVVSPGKLASYFGFTPSEVAKLAEGGSVSLEELKAWYDGYQIGSEPSIYNPFSVIRAISHNECDSYWSSTSAYDSVSNYISMNFDGLKDDIIYMLGGGRCSVNTTKFQNDMSIINSKDDVLTVLIHLGYLSYDKANKECYIPNKEVLQEMQNAVEGTDWTPIISTLQSSKKLLNATLAMNEEAVARGLELAHDDNTSILSYNDEESLSCALSIAYFYARNEYIVHRELATGKGYADLVLIPRRNVAKPAMVIELKYDKSADTALDQIRSKNYPAKVAEYTGDMLLVGINYDKKSKAHTCKIEKYTK